MQLVMQSVWLFPEPQPQFLFIFLLIVNRAGKCLLYYFSNTIKSHFSIFMLVFFFVYILSFFFWGEGRRVVSMSSMLYVCILSTKCHLNPSHSVCSTQALSFSSIHVCLGVSGCVWACVLVYYPCASLLRFENSYDDTHARVYKYSRLRSFYILVLIPSATPCNGFYFPTL